MAHFRTKLSRTSAGLTLAAALLAGGIGIGMAQAAGVPKLDVKGMCRDSARDNTEMQFDAKRCLRSENDALSQLKQQWASYQPAQQALCTRTATMGGTASYVELITCLEMQRYSAKLTTSPAGLKGPQR